MKPAMQSLPTLRQHSIIWGFYTASAQSDYRLQRCFATKALFASEIAPLWLFNGQPVEVAFAAID
jgi:hypothetical protein